jgi:glycosyltransferase involved in cell wall biosynthesis
MFSVIIPLFNKGSFIEKCLLSVLNQTLIEFELIIINDGSTDNSLEMVKQFVDSRIIIVDQKNSGVSVARNNGVTQAKYEHLAFLDADDWWDLNYLMEMKSLIEEFPEAGIYGSKYYIVKNGLNKTANIGVGSDFTKGLLNYCQVYSKTLCMPLWTGATVLRKSIFEAEGGFKPNLKLGEDFDLWIRIVLKYLVAFLNKPLSYYNQDIPMQFRAVGNLFEPEHHFLWNLEFLAKEETKISDLKYLLDKLRVYGLFPYYLKSEYRIAARQELSKVHWSIQPLKERWKYNSPLIIQKIGWAFRTAGSFCKQRIIRFLS